MTGKPKTIIVSPAAGKCLMTICAGREFAMDGRKRHGIHGVDMGMFNFATFSDGLFIERLSA
jgi:hypothetical protein